MWHARRFTESSTAGSESGEETLFFLSFPYVCPEPV
jgi:hypothetical protein